MYKQRTLETKTNNKRCRMDKRLKFSDASAIGLCWACDPTTKCKFKEWMGGT